ncbi:MAG: hypothetical protein COU85_00205 [Candidatus Portnoybacteria bacterium CG10_big_fil_rev_8_21_14_0_10_44_7]|uniref:Bacterial sugar transferase domain-containing protein n=1 Tax=Candidatus Portnoybacteria bacterium CG10_big_fil_rev_8_21_14_0_10_44_7 TaxID=1974816 RepID=A0A2M8KJJ4_9BACT|nr:MAG: hypothetical protein COU85_00205 [Candidatus Portnoybacteria bacterium CG10_big_fil_rev_8_21_14_0_10_44_7]
MKKTELFFNAILVPLDYVMLVAAGLVAYALRTSPLVAGWRPVMFEVTLSSGEYYRLVFLVALFWLLAFVFSGLYRIKKNVHFLEEFPKVVLAASLGLVGIIFYLFLVRGIFESRFIIFTAWSLAIFFVGAGRILVRWIEKFLLKKFYHGAHRVLVVGNGAWGMRLKKEIEKRPDLGYRVVGFLPVINMERIKSFVANPGVDEIVLAEIEADKEKVLDLVSFCEETQVVFKFIPNLFQSLATNIQFDTIAGIPIVEFKKTPLDGWGKITKRIIDVLVSAFGLVVLSPILALVALWIRLDSAGPVFYRSKRISQGREFWLYKFRSMVDQAEEKKKELVEQNERNDGPLFKIKDDPRITRAGRFLRRTRLDELPQFFNALRGDISLIGPRPHLPSEIAQYKHHHKKLLTIKAGITGMAQVSGSSDLSFEDEVRLDSFYIDNWSLYLDLKILLRTILLMFFDQSAC